MATFRALDDSLIEEARTLGGHLTKEAAVHEALEEYVARRKPRRILDLFGKLEWDPDYDHKDERRQR